MPKKRKKTFPEFTTPLDPINAAINRCSTSRDKASQRILIMRVGAYGDILMGTPLLAAIREQFPSAHVTWIAEHSERQAIDANPHIDEIIIWDSGYWKRLIRSLRWPKWLFDALRFRSMLRRRKYDTFISFQPEEWQLLARNTGAKIRVGVFDTFRRYYGESQNLHHKQYYTHSFGYPSLPDHRIDQYLIAAAPIGLREPISKQMVIGYTQEDRNIADKYLSENGIEAGEKFIVFAPMTTWPTKCWPMERFAELGRRLTANDDTKIVIIGSAKEGETVHKLGGLIGERAVVMAGGMGFRGMAALVDRASLLVSGDTGPMHVATALNVPRVSIFGATSADWYGPITGKYRAVSVPVPCGPCDQKICPNKGETHEQCLKLITVEMVYGKCADLLGKALVTSDRS